MTWGLHHPGLGRERGLEQKSWYTAGPRKLSQAGAGPAAEAWAFKTIHDTHFYCTLSHTDCINYWIYISTINPEILTPCLPCFQWWCAVGQRNSCRSWDKQVPFPPAFVVQHALPQKVRSRLEVSESFQMVWVVSKVSWISLSLVTMFWREALVLEWEPPNDNGGADLVAYRRVMWKTMKQPQYINNCDIWWHL